MALFYPDLAGFNVGLFIIFAVWTIFWKGFALWHSAKNSQKYWFIALLILNTVGILELIYLFFFRLNRKKKTIFGKPRTKKRKPKSK